MRKLGVSGLTPERKIAVLLAEPETLTVSLPFVFE